MYEYRTTPKRRNDGCLHQLHRCKLHQKDEEKNEAIFANNDEMQQNINSLQNGKEARAEFSEEGREKNKKEGTLVITCN